MSAVASVAPETTGSEAQPERPRRLAVVLVVLLALLAYVPALDNDFAFDDTLARSTTNEGQPDRVISQVHGPWFYFSSQYWFGEGRESRLYRPVTICSYALTYWLVSKPLLPPEWEAFPHHLLNLLLNGWAACLVLWWMIDLRVGPGGALLTAALFGVHALHSEVVAGIVGRAELLAFCFGMAGLWAWRRSESARPGLWLSLSGVLFFAALCSKENAVAWLGLLPCYVVARAWRSNAGIPAVAVLRRHALRLLLVCVPPLVLFLLLRAHAISGWRQDVFYAANPLYHEPDSVRLLTAVKVWGYGVYKCVAPFSLACLYGLPAIPLVTSWLDPGFLGAAVVLLAWLFWGLRRPAQSPLLFLSVAVFFGFSVITSNVPFAIGTIFGERLYFIPSLGVCMLPAVLWERSSSAWGRRVLVSTCVVWVVAAVVVDFHRSGVWKDNRTLMLNDAVVQPNCASLQVKAAVMHRWLQKLESDQKKFHENRAWALLRRAQQLDPDYVNAIVTEATFLAEDGKHDEALAILRRALRARRRAISGLEASIRSDIAMILIEEKGQKAEGVRELQNALQLQPRQLMLRLALIEHGKGILKREELHQLLVDGAAMYPNDVMMWVLQADFIYEHAEITAQNAKTIVDLIEGAFSAVSEKATHDKHFVRARLQLANCLRALRRVDEARRSYEILLALAEATPEQKQEARQGLAALSR
ncbi:MAG: hypothetical protein ACYTKC_20290 [Planctomycetota bacterium]|jgi:hypothetical protein